MLHRMHREGGRAGREISYCLGLCSVHTSRSLSSSFLRAARLLKFSPSGSAPTFVHLSSSSPDRPDHCAFRTLASRTRASTRPSQNLPRLKALRHLTASAHPYRISPNLYRFLISPFQSAPCLYTTLPLLRTLRLPRLTTHGLREATCSVITF